MAEIIPFPSRSAALSAVEQNGEPQAGEGFLGGPPVKNRLLDRMIEEIAELYEDPPEVECTYCRFDLREAGGDPESLEIDFASLTELVVFSPEIQKQSLEGSVSDENPRGPVRWGDVFLKCGDVYPFLLTVYTEEYVGRQLSRHGEKITPSPKDIVLSREELSPADIIRAVIKWANLYSPQQRGKPVRLESEAVLRDLICDPGIEVVVAEPS
jgi:hypothetical protein